MRSLPVAAARGVQTYEFAVKLLNVAALTVDADGNLTDGADFRLSRALMLGTNSVIYPCSAWRLPAPDRVQFSCDDSTLPKRAYPYVIDPTTSFSPAASGDDGHLEGYGASWPPGYTRSITDYPQFSVVNSYDGAEYAWSVGLIRYDTSGLTADATITDALAYIWPSFRSDKDNFSVRAEYYGTVYWPIGSDDYTTSVGDNAIADVDLGTLSTGTWHGLTMTTLGNINKTGYTGLRWGLTSSQPTDYNSLGPQSFDGGSQYCPYLSITYTVPARPFIIVVTDSTP
ncbi:MAG TPA: hypothetical protein VLH56_18910 [Dissulfurispiraceae bacterium]|nr:hypothetical protein [Dissulfurispiraceae bacterium]